MGKVLDTYNGLTAAQLKTRAAIPAQANIITGASYIDCSNITVTDVKNVIGEGTTTVGGLCQSTKVNPYSGFSPIEWYISSNVVSNRVKTPYSLGSFAGYNHSAIAPYLNSASYLALSSGMANQTYSFNVQLNLAEVNWFLNLGLTHCHIVVNGVIKASFAIETEYTASQEKTINISVTAPAVNTESTYTIETWFGAAANKQGKLVQAGNSLTLKVLNPALFNTLRVLDTAANRLAVGSAAGLPATEYISAIYSTITNKSISTAVMTGTYNLTADVRIVANGGYSRTINISASDLLFCNVRCYKTNTGTGITSSTYDVNTNYRILYSASGIPFTFAIPTALKPIADGDEYFITFDNLR